MKPLYIRADKHQVTALVRYWFCDLSGHCELQYLVWIMYSDECIAKKKKSSLDQIAFCRLQKKCNSFYKRLSFEFTNSLTSISVYMTCIFLFQQLLSCSEII